MHPAPSQESDLEMHGENSWKMVAELNIPQKPHRAFGGSGPSKAALGDKDRALLHSCFRGSSCRIMAPASPRRDLEDKELQKTALFDQLKGKLGK